MVGLFDRGLKCWIQTLELADILNYNHSAFSKFEVRVKDFLV